MTVASKAQVLYVHWERHGKDCEVEIFGAGASAAFLGGASIDSALGVLRGLPLIEAFSTVEHKVGPSSAAKEDILRIAETAMRVDAPQGEIVFCSLSTREEVATALASWQTS